MNPLQLRCYYFPFKMYEALRLKKINLWIGPAVILKKKGVFLHFNNFKQKLSLLFKEDLNHVYLKLSLRIWKIFLCFQCIFTILLIRACPFITISLTWTVTSLPCTQKCFVPSLIEINPAILEKKCAALPLNKQTMDNKWSQKLI